MKPSTFECAWSDLNTRLRQIEVANGGLPAALSELRRQQLETGFIKDGLDGVQRYTFTHPRDPEKLFRAQYNAKRALRFNGAGRSEAPEGVEPVNGGCFLCRENICWQQRGTQLGYEIPLSLGPYFAWMNPFPLLPMHVVVASAEHKSQEWLLSGAELNGASRLLSDLLELADRMPGYFGYFNGLNAGASIPNHLHFHFCRRPYDTPEFPLEYAAHSATRSDGHAELINDYPLVGALWRGARQDVFEWAWSWIEQWAKRNKNRLQGLTANLIASKEEIGDTLNLYFIPRVRGDSMIDRGSEHIGGLEVLGEFVFSSPEEKFLLDSGAISYFSLEERLAQIHAPLFVS